MGHPFDTVRIRIQQQKFVPASGAPAAAVAASTMSGGSWPRVLVQMVLKEGPFTPYRGMIYPLTFNAIQSAVAFQGYGQCLRWLQGRLGDDADSSRPHVRPSITQQFIAGAWGGALQTLCTVPVEVMKIRLQLQTAVRGSPGYKGPLKMASEVFRDHGVAGYFRGSFITLVREVPSFGIYFGGYELALQALTPPERENNPTAAARFLAGGVAGVTSWFSIYPFDIIKTRVQSHLCTKTVAPCWRTCAGQIYKEGGWRAFWRGLTPTLMRAFLVNGGCFLFYDVSLRAMAGKPPAEGD